MSFERKANWVQSITEGAMEGFKLSCGIAAVLVAFMGLLGVVNVLVGGIGGWVGYPQFNLQTLLGWFFTPLAWLMGVDPQDSGRVGELLGLRLVTAELPAYFKLADWMAGPEPLGTRSMVITVYALCGFAHIPSLGIFVGGLTALAPERASDIGSVAIRSLIAATLACLMTGAIAGMLCGGNPAALLAK